MAKLKVILQGRPIWLFIVGVAVALSVGLMIPTSSGFRGPLVDINDGLMAAVLIALGGFVAQLYLRMGKLEADVARFRDENDGLRADLTAAASFIDRLGLWIAAGMPPGRTPKPAKRLEEHIDAELWTDESTAVGGTE